MYRPKLKPAILLLILSSFILYSALPAGAEIPFGVKPQQVEVNFTVVPDEKLQVGIGDNNLPGPDDNKPNKRWGIEIGEIDYQLTFWNVGAQGGTSGILLWKKNYADAALTVSWEAQTAGFANGPAEDIKSPLTGGVLHNTWHMEPATKIPEFNSKTYKLQFTGGPNGSFTEIPPYQGRNPVKGRVIDGKKVEIIPSGGSGEFGFPLESAISSSVQPFFGWDAEVDEETEIYAVLLSGTARIQKDPSMESTDSVENWRPIDPGDGINMSLNKKVPINIGNQIITGSNSRVLLKFQDGSEFRIKSNTILQVAQGGLILRIGDARFNLIKVEGKYEVYTPTTVCGVLGTTFAIHVNEDGSSDVKLIEGQLETVDSSKSSTVILHTGEAVKANTQGFGQISKFDIAAVEKEWAEGWEYTEAGNGGITPWLLYAGGLGMIVLLAMLLVLRSRSRKLKSTA